MLVAACLHYRLPYYFSITEICPEILELNVKQLNIE